MKRTLCSSAFGTLILDDELFEPPIYSAAKEIAGHGTVCITLVAPVERSPDWSHLLSAAEETYRLIVENEVSIRTQAAPALLELHRSGYGDEWRNEAEKLAEPMRLKQLTFFSNGSFELWYDGGAVFHYRDVRLALDPEFCLTEASLGQ